MCIRESPEMLDWSLNHNRPLASAAIPYWLMFGTVIIDCTIGAVSAVPAASPTALTGCSCPVPSEVNHTRPSRVVIAPYG